MTTKKKHSIPGQRNNTVRNTHKTARTQKTVDSDVLVHLNALAKSEHDSKDVYSQDSRNNREGRTEDDFDDDTEHESQLNNN